MTKEHTGMTRLGTAVLVAPLHIPFQGDVEQIVTDPMAYEGIGLDEFLVDLSWAARDAQELKDVSAEVFTAARAAGL
ncbi:hypothetical protein ACWD5F_24645 [Streptomyces sp. NPDC002499]